MCAFIKTKDEIIQLCAVSCARIKLLANVPIYPKVVVCKCSWDRQKMSARGTAYPPRDSWAGQKYRAAYPRRVVGVCARVAARVAAGEAAGAGGWCGRRRERILCVCDM
jgi:hypothetical protein